MALLPVSSRAAGLLAAAAAVVVASCALAASGAELRVFEPVAGHDELPADGVEGRTGRLSLDVDALRAHAKKLEARLFADALPLRLRRTSKAAGVWRGGVHGDDFSAVTLLFSETGPDAGVVGTISTSSAVFHISTRADGTLWVKEQAWGAFPPERHTEDVAGDEPPSRKDQLDGESDDGSVIDVLVPYTLRAMCKEAGKNYPCDDSSDNKKAIERLIALAEDETNEAMRNSDIATEIRVVHSFMVDKGYDERDYNFENVLSHTRRGEHGLGETHYLRNEHRADVVQVIIDMAAYCGIGIVGATKPQHAFSVVNVACATGFYSFGHELAHVFGCNHNREDSPVSDGYAFGYRDSGKFRTIMSYSCADSCPRVAQFSNPNVDYKGRPTGVSLSSNKAAYCAKTIGENAKGISRLVESRGGPDQVPIPEDAQSPEGGGKNCGDGKLKDSEECDDGNSKSGDGCHNCLLEAGWRIKRSKNRLFTACGDNIVAGSEECDDGKKEDGDGCSSKCKIESRRRRRRRRRRR